MKRQHYAPRSVPVATFDMFGSSQNVRLPASATATSITDSSIRATFMQMSKPNIQIKKDGFASLIEKIPQVSDEQEFLVIVTPSIALFDQTFIEFNSDIRLLAVNFIQMICNKLGKEIVTYAPKIFPILLLYSCDTEPSVSDAAKAIFNGYFSTSEKKNGIMSKLRNEICLRIRYSFSDLREMEKHFSNNDEIENWGRIASATFSLSATLLSACRFAPEVLSSFGEFNLRKWILAKDSKFLPQSTAPMRASAYLYLALVTQCDLVGDEYKDVVIKLISSESSPLCQVRLMKIINIYLDKQYISTEQVRNALLPSITLYYDPVKTGIPALLSRIADQAFVQTALRQISSLADIELANTLFKLLFDLSNEKTELKPTVDCLYQLFEGAISTSPPSRFLSQVDLKYFIGISSDSRVRTALEKGNEDRVIQYLQFIDTQASLEWLKTRETININTVIRLIKSLGSVIIRKTWPSIVDIPIEKANDQKRAELILLYAKTEEMPHVIKEFPGSVRYFLPQWSAGYDCLRCEELMNLIPELLKQQIGLYKILKQIFPQNEQLEQLMEEAVLNEIKETDEADPVLFDIYTPTPAVLTAFIFCLSVEVVEPGDKIIPLLIDHIPKIVQSQNQANLAAQVHKLVVAGQIDPLSIKVSPNEAQIFCLEFWERVGFDKMPADKFIELLGATLQKKSPWLSTFLYIRNIDWGLVPLKLWDYICAHPELADVAIKANDTLSLATVCAANNLNFTSLPMTGIVLEALSLNEPPEEANNDFVSNVIQTEWNHTKPDINNKTDSNTLNLRQAVSYLQHSAPIINSIDSILPYVIDASKSTDRFDFFLCLRALSLIRDIDIPFENLLSVLFEVVSRVVDFYPLPSTVEKEFSQAMRAGQLLTPNQFLQFVNKCGPLFKTAASKTIARQVVPLILYFNVWDVIETRLDGNLDLSVPLSWHLVVGALESMPYQKRLDMVNTFTDELYAIFDSLNIEGDDFIRLISTFPATAFNWSTTLGNNKLHPLNAEMMKRGTQRVFEILAKKIKKIKLGNTTIQTNIRNMIVQCTYVEDAASVPIKMDISIPDLYPFKHARVSCNIDKGGNSADLRSRVAAAIVQGQGVEAGIHAWHQFIVKELQEKEPCTICYSYLDEQQRVPKVKCSVCGQKFHGACLSKWFAHCLQPTCPFCASPWKPKG